MSRRPITIEKDGTIRADGQRLRFFDFSRIAQVGEIRLERYANDPIEVFELAKWYRRRLAANVVRGLPEAWWAYSHFADGTRISKEHRLMYRSNADLRSRYANPFLAGPRIFCK